MWYACSQELVSSNTNQRNWRGILIALLVIVVVLALIVTSVVLLTPPDEGPRVKGHRFKLQDILGHDFAALRFNGSWVSVFASREDVLRDFLVSTRVVKTCWETFRSARE
uniref:Uncharacterized protein n=1 Tax=Timema tahoe TaxID=61484 RepID=A0A7R9NXK5_9NEOP|nr:unnamed protein product [Timema tahoe]